VNERIIKQLHLRKYSVRIWTGLKGSMCEVGKSKVALFCFKANIFQFISAMIEVLVDTVWLFRPREFYCIFERIIMLFSKAVPLYAMETHGGEEV
jgi:hypothetical protein